MEVRMETRKVYVSGGSTYVLSLPKKWVVENRIEAGDSLIVTRQASSLLIEPGMMEEEPEVVEINTSHIASPEALERLIIAYYLVGYDTIKIKLDPKAPRYKDSARRILDFLIGVEIVEDLGDTVTMEILLDHRKMPTPQALRRIHLIGRSMISDAINVMKAGDKNLAKDVISREREVDRLYFLVVRQLKSAVQYQQVAEKLGIQNQRDALGYRIVVKSLERIADHVENVVNTYLQLTEAGKDRPNLREFVSLADLILGIYDSAMEAFFNRKKDKAEEVFRGFKGIKKRHLSLSNKFFKEDIDIPDAMHRKSILDSLGRIASYSSDIAEIALNMAVEVPSTRASQ
jgi:phosphate uptake regulator